MITHLKSGGTVLTGNAIQWFRLRALVGALELEIRGLRRSRGRTAYSILCEELRLSGPRQQVLEQAREIVNSVREQQEEETEK